MSDLIFLETSALTGEGVQEIYLKCARSILSKIDTGILDPDTPGSGVQNGDSATAKEQAEKRRRKYQKNPDEGCC